jgi:hypothetical protein
MGPQFHQQPRLALCNQPEGEGNMAPSRSGVQKTGPSSGTSKLSSSLPRNRTPLVLEGKAAVNQILLEPTNGLCPPDVLD